MAKTRVKTSKICMMLLVVSMAFLSLVLTACTKESGPGELDSFARCLATGGAVMYGSEWCSHCKSQKQLLGSSFQYIPYINCDKAGELCSRAGIMGVPTWTINGKNYPGKKNLYELAQLSGCELP